MGASSVPRTLSRVTIFPNISVKLLNLGSARDFLLERVTVVKETDTERFTNLGKLNFLMVVRFQARGNFCYCPAASKNDTHFKKR